MELSDGSAAVAGDVLQIKYSAGRGTFGAIVSLDGRGTITWHLPSTESGGPIGARSPRLEEGGVILPAAYELDNAPYFERFFLVTSDTEFNLDAVATALRDLSVSGRAEAGILSLPAGLACKAFLVHKTGGMP
jgi:hypothetical protein